MFLFLVLLWCSAVVYDAGARTVFAVIPRFGEFNSRLGGCKFPVRITTGIREQELDLLHVFAAKRRLRGENRLNSRFDGKNRQFLPVNRSADWRRVLKAIEGNRNFVFPLLCPRVGLRPARSRRRSCAGGAPAGPRFRLGSLRKIGSADEARLQSDLDLLREAHLPG